MNISTAAFSVRSSDIPGQIDVGRKNCAYAIWWKTCQREDLPSVHEAALMKESQFDAACLKAWSNAA